MPELPEVETTVRGITPYIIGKTIQQVIVRQPQLRWLLPANFTDDLTGVTIKSVTRRAKYLLIETDKGTLIGHLGMSGSLRIVTTQTPVKLHDHVDFILNGNVVLRFNDPRRFGALVWTTDNVLEHKLLKDLGVEPLTDDFNSALLFSTSRKRRVPIKTFIMNGHIVVGVGNIYANESLFMANILPTRHAGDITLNEYEKLATCIRFVLKRSIEQGGTTLRDFVNPEGHAGYFQQQLNVYGRTHLPCVHCGQKIQEIQIANRGTFFCQNCQH